jgi:exopolysaccharide biosynthesis polyprenyl glycosylphosphotransferase
VVLPGRAVPRRRRLARGSVEHDDRRRLRHEGGLIATLDVVAMTPMSIAVTPLGGAYAAMVIAALVVTGGYRRRFALSLSDDAPWLVSQLAVVALAVGVVAADSSALTPLLRWVPASIVLVCAGRAVSYALIRTGRAQTKQGEPTLVVGAGAVGCRIARMLAERPHYGLTPVGFVDTVTDRQLPLPLLGAVENLPEVLERHRVRNVIVAFGPIGEEALVDVLRQCEDRDVEVRVVPRFFELGLWSPGPNIDDVCGIPLRRMRQAATRRIAWSLKRALDVAIAGTTLVLVAPLIGAIAAVVAVSSPGPVLLRQERVGQGGRRFDVLKFRTMGTNTDGETTWSVAHDARVTAVGRFLRRTSLDELPQLLNVLRGDMSLVGPRPERPYFVEIFSSTVSRYYDRHRVPAGMTGLAQVNGLRGDTPIEDRAILDNQYIEHWSLWRDLVILVRTLGAVIRPPAAVKLDVSPVIDLRDGADGVHAQGTVPEPVVAAGGN